MSHASPGEVRVLTAEGTLELPQGTALERKGT
jgi:hypothetical protein